MADILIAAGASVEALDDLGRLGLDLRLELGSGLGVELGSGLGLGLGLGFGLREGS